VYTFTLDEKGRHPIKSRLYSLIAGNMKKVVFTLPLAVFGYVLFMIYINYTGDFRLSNISYEETLYEPKNIAITIDNEKLKKIKEALSQPFHYLGQGNQAYAFLSADSQYVLKFFKFGHLKKSFIWNYLPEVNFLTTQLKNKNLSQQKRFMKVFDGYQIAYIDDPENTGVLFIHLNKTNYLNLSVTVYDKLGFEHEINLDDLVFVVQEKVTPTKEVLSKLLNNHDVEGAKIKIRQLFDLYLTDYKKGIFDRDHNLIYNTGFNKRKAVRLDVGKLRKNESVKNPEFYINDLKKISLKRVDSFMQKYYPKHKAEIADYMNQQIEVIGNAK
jgi:hypothetical protein